MFFDSRAGAFIRTNQFQLNISGGNLVISPSRRLMELNNIDTPGYLAFDGRSNFTSRYPTSDGTFSIINPYGYSQNAVIDVENDSSYQRI